VVDPRAIARALGEWFPQAQRDLSWRRTRDPYAIWVSEIMLQQTRVETVETYYGSFLERFPDVGTLAAADEQAVLEAWSGLGYYRRARLLHKGAGYVAGELGGVLPQDAVGLRKIPGIGAYTAGAIASIAFDRPVPLVDGNVARVHSRLAAIADPAEQDAGAKAHWAFVEEVLQHGSPRVLAQALMELGATVCTPKNVRCEQCPVRDDCRAHARGLQAEIPAPKKKKASSEHHYWAVGLTWGSRLLLERRPDGGLLAGMWCLPLVERVSEDAPGALVHEQLGVPVAFEDAPARGVKHVFTHRIWHLSPWACRARKRPRIRNRTDGRMFAWIEPGERPPGGIPSVTEKLLGRLGF
jgi:A/G-specific adenine glycosylase